MSSKYVLIYLNELSDCLCDSAQKETLRLEKSVVFHLLLTINYIVSEKKRSRAIAIALIECNSVIIDINDPSSYKVSKFCSP